MTIGNGNMVHPTPCRIITIRYDGLTWMLAALGKQRGIDLRYFVAMLGAIVKAN